jgi:hypothetical protein
VWGELDRLRLITLTGSGGIRGSRYRVFCDFISDVAARDSQHASYFGLHSICLFQCSLNEAPLEGDEQLAEIDAGW